MPKLPSRGDLRAIDSALGDITGKLDRISSLSSGWSKNLVNELKTHRDINRELDDLRSNLGALTQQQAARVVQLEAAAEKLGNAWSRVAKIVGGSLFRAFDRFGKQILGLGLATFERGINSLYHGIYKVYELTERWTRLMGEFRNRLGATTKNVRELSKVAAEVEGAIYGLTGAFGQGAPLVNEFVEGLGRIEDVSNPKNLKELVKTGVFASRVLGITAGQAGELTRVLQQLGEDTGEQKELFLQISAGAKAAGVSTAHFGREIAGSKDFLASFGIEGRKTFIQMTTFAQRLGVSLKTLEGFTRMTDVFDQTAQSVAKVNTVFGTTISSLDIMLEQDPSKRLETVRQALLSQGKTFDMLSRQERDFLADTLKMSREELAGVIRTGKTLSEVQGDQERAAEQQRRSQANMAKLINKTATTLFSFGAAWDRVTRAISELIRPFTDVLGLTKSGEKGAKSFGQVMAGLFDRLVKFIREVAANPEWSKFMKRLASDAVDLAQKVSAIATGPKLGEFIKTVTTAASDFYDMMKKAFTFTLNVGQRLMPTFKFVLTHLKEIMGMWLAMKVGMGAASMASGIGGAINLVSGATGGKGVGRLGRGLGGAGLGMLTGQAGGAAFKAMGGSIQHEGLSALGGAAGGAIGMMFGPIGAAVGGLIGKLGGELIGRAGSYLMGTVERTREFFYRETKEVAEARMAAEGAERQLAEAVRARLDAEQFYSMKIGQFSERVEARQRRMSAQDALLLGLDSELTFTKKRSIAVSKDERAELLARVGDMQRLGVGGVRLTKAFEQLSSGGELTRSTLSAIRETSQTYLQTLERLNRESEIVVERETRRENLAFEVTKKRVGDELALADADMKAKQAQVEKLKSGTIEIRDLAKAAKDSSITQYLTAEELERVNKQTIGRHHLADIVQQRMIAKADLSFREAQKKRAEVAKKAEDLEARHQDNIHRIQLRSAIMMSQEFAEFRRALPAGTELDDAFRNFVLDKGGVDGISLTDAERKMVLGKPGSFDANMAGGGIVSGPMRALLGEAGPEAVIPLKALASGISSRQPSKFGGAAAERLVNFAAGRAGSSSGSVRVVAGDVYLDGKLVGRHLARSLLTTEQGG